MDLKRKDAVQALERIREILAGEWLKEEGIVMCGRFTIVPTIDFHERFGLPARPGGTPALQRGARTGGPGHRQ